MDRVVNGVLDGIRVIDLTNALAGASATKILADLGAEIIKVESPEAGDFTRTLVPYVFQAFNRNKRSVAVDLKQPAGPGVVRRLIRSSDVFIQSMRPGAVDDLGLGIDIITAENPRIIYASFSGFGPSSMRRGVDAVVQAESGLAVLQGSVLGNLSFVDEASGLTLALAVLAALMNRAVTGQVDHVEVNLLDTALYLQSAPLAEFSVTGRQFRPEINVGRFPAVSVFEAADGPFFMAPYWEDDWIALCELIGNDALANDPRFTNAAERALHAPELRAFLGSAFALRPRTAWVDALQSRGVMAAPVNGHAEVLADPQVSANDSLEDITMSTGEVARFPRAPFRFVDLPPSQSQAAPQIGDDTDAVLSELGWSIDELVRLRAEGIIAGPENAVGRVSGVSKVGPDHA
jgi:CoA:oxalate CoA-transferase